jgi:hypothetical protein
MLIYWVNIWIRSTTEMSFDWNTDWLHANSCGISAATCKLQRNEFVSYSRIQISAQDAYQLLERTPPRKEATQFCVVSFHVGVCSNNWYAFCALIQVRLYRAEWPSRNFKNIQTELWCTLGQLTPRYFLSNDKTLLFEQMLTVYRTIRQLHILTSI